MDISLELFDSAVVPFAFIPVRSAVDRPEGAPFAVVGLVGRNLHSRQPARYRPPALVHPLFLERLEWVGRAIFLVSIVVVNEFLLSSNAKGRAGPGLPLQQQAEGGPVHPLFVVRVADPCRGGIAESAEVVHLRAPFRRDDVVGGAGKASRHLRCSSSFSFSLVLLLFPFSLFSFPTPLFCPLSPPFSCLPPLTSHLLTFSPSS
mmetsp:Transcript_42755/g.110219  ORF Transcript_42755/g.110219 Transcript_42755/m.110219 type:complete len:204 (+) Transcript_42755:1416-2027(+)